MNILIINSSSITDIIAISYCTLGLQYMGELMGVSLQLFGRNTWMFWTCPLHIGQTYCELDY